jgi:hypothetical protein
MSATGWAGDATANKAIGIFDPEPYLEDDLTQGGELAILDETKETLARPVARLEIGMAWAEDPPSRRRHLIANLEVKSAEAVSELKGYCNFFVYRSRAETEQDFYVAARRDVLRRLTARGGSPAASSPSTRMCCWPRTSAPSFKPGHSSHHRHKRSRGPDGRNSKEAGFGQLLQLPDDGVAARASNKALLVTNSPLSISNTTAQWREISRRQCELLRDVRKSTEPASAMSTASALLSSSAGCRRGDASEVFTSVCASTRRTGRGKRRVMRRSRSV